MERNALGGDNKLGPTVDEFARMVQVWRIGSITDSKSGMMPYKCATVNVVIEPWSLEMIQLEYNPYFGESLALAVGEYADVAALIQLALAFVQTNDGVLKTTEAIVKEVYTPSLASEVAGLEQTDKSYLDDLKLMAVLRPKDVRPSAANCRRGKRGRSTATCSARVATTRRRPLICASFGPRTQATARAALAPPCCPAGSRRHGTSWPRCRAGRQPQAGQVAVGAAARATGYCCQSACDDHGPACADAAGPPHPGRDPSGSRVWWRVAANGERRTGKECVCVGLSVDCECPMPASCT